MKKLFVVIALFALPLVAYLFFASGVNSFARLPVLTENVGDLSGFHDLNGNKVVLEDKITVLGFFGENPLEYIVGAYNLSEKIYDTYYQFNNFQFVFIVEKGNAAEAKELAKKLGKVVDMKKWKFAIGSREEINQLFNSLNTNLTLNDELATPNVFIIDKDVALRGRSNDEDNGEGKNMLYGYNSRSIAEINNKMDDDVKVILAEYRLELKKYNSNPVKEK